MFAANDTKRHRPQMNGQNRTGQQRKKNEYATPSLRQHDRLRGPRPRSATFPRHLEQQNMLGTRSAANESHRVEGDRIGSDRDPQFRGKRGDHLLDRDKPAKAADLVGDLQADLASGDRRFVRHGVLHRWRSVVELHRGVDLWERRL